MKSDVVTERDALRAPDKLTRLPLLGTADFGGELWLRSPNRKDPDWQGFLAPILESAIDGHQTSSVAAVLFVRVDDRLVAITFGYGRNLLKTGSYELGFGQRVALNRIDHTQIRSLDLRTYEDIVVQTKKQTSRSSAIGAFGLDVSRDLLRAVTGEPRDNRLGSRLSGSDSLTVSIAIEPSGLGKLCRDVLVAFSEEAYKEHFGWIDNLREVRDRSLLDELNSELISALVAETEPGPYLSVPDAVDWDSVDGFRIGDKGGLELSDLVISDYLRSLGVRKRTLRVDKLRRENVSLKYSTSDDYMRKWTLYDCLVWEVTKGERLYALSEGRWFEIESTFVGKVQNFVNTIPRLATPLPPAFKDETENSYNERVAAAEPTRYLCVDRDLVKAEGAKTTFEFCDLLTADRQFIHVKKSSRSSTLSHLFSQGTVSARTFLDDGESRLAIIAKLPTRPSTDGAIDWKALIPDANVRPIASEFEVVYAVIGRGAGEAGGSLPFFSQLNLMQHAKVLQGLGFKVSLQLVAYRDPGEDASERKTGV
jgi:uncharacterized protein (TIGR04141 family)